MKFKKFMKNIWDKIKKIYFISYDFVLSHKIYFLIGLSSILLLVILLFLTKWYISLIVTVLETLVVSFICWKRGMFVQKKKINKNKKNNVKVVKNKTKNSKTKKKKDEKTIVTVLRYGLIVLCVFFLLGLISVGVFFAYIVMSTEKFNPDNLVKTEATVLYDKDGKEFARLFPSEGNREKITYDELSEVLVDAIIATEDSRFFQHNGVDIPRFAKATFGQLLGKAAGGASTLTMQIAKNNINGTDSHGIKGIVRKFKDVYVAVFQIEKNYTKQQIIELYANDTCLGASACGVEQASKTYFGKHAKDLNLAEASLLAGLFQAPNAYNPFKNPKAASARRSTVLYLMELHGYITSEERKLAESIPVESLLVDSISYGSEYQSFIDTVVDEIYNFTKDENGKGINPYVTPLEIYTTMDRSKQDAMNKIFNGEGYKWENDKVQAGSVVLDVNTGGIVAVANGRNMTGVWNFNYATDIKRQIGSTAKPLYDYGPGIEYNNWSTYGPVVDEAHTYSAGSNLYNWDGGYDGLETLRSAIIRSRNVPALKAFQSINNAKIREFVTNLNLNPEYEGGTYIHEAHAIGSYGNGTTSGESPLSMAGAYAAFANGGYYHTPHSFTKFVYRQTDETVENKVTTKKAMSTQTSYMMTSILKDTAKSYPYISYVGGEVAAKTGTTNFDAQTMRRYKMSYNAVNDLWVAGYNPNYSIALWYGYPELTGYADKGYYNVLSSTQNHRLWAAIANKMFSKNATFKISSAGVESVAIEKETYPAKLASEYTPKEYITYELFKSGTAPTEVSDRFARLNDVTNLNVSINNLRASLSWEAIATPKYLDTEFLKTYFASVYKSERDQNKYLNKRIDQNNKKLGSVVYNIYIKNENGELVSIGSTKGTTFEYQISAPTTFVVKASYELFTQSYGIDNSSIGTEITTTFSGNLITSALKGSSNISLNKGEEFNDPGVMVSENGLDVSNYTVNKVYYLAEDTNNPITDINTNNVGNYKIKYEITYNNYHNVLWRNVEIKNES